MKMKKIVIFSEIKWNFLEQRHQLIAKHMSESGWSVFFIERIPSRVPGLFEVFKIAFQIIKNLSKKKSYPHPENIKLVKSFYLPPKNVIFRAINDLLSKFFYSKLCENGIAYSFTPTSASIIKYMHKYNFQVCFDIVHNWWEIPWWGQNQHSLTNYLVQNATFVICDSAALTVKLRERFNREISIVTPGVDESWLEPDRSSKLIEKCEPNSVAFFGNLRGNSDIDLVNNLIERGYKLNLYGLIDDEIKQELKGNYIFHGQKDRISLFKELLRYDFILLPYIDNEFSSYISPAKYFECLAVGSPIITRANFNHLDGWDAYTFNVDLNDKDIGHALVKFHKNFYNNGLESTSIKLASKNTWTIKLKKIESIIKKRPKF